jgi:DNA-binding NarL/FixJ family response regulator
MPSKPRLIVVDDHRLLVEALREMLGPHFEIVGTAYAGDELLAMLPTTPADCMLLDLSLPGRSGLELLGDIRRLQPGIQVVVLTMHVDRVLADAAFAAGASGFVPKDSGMAEVALALHEALAGRRYLSDRVPKVTHRLGPEAKHLALSRLTPRQQEILGLLAEGMSSAQIGMHLGLSTSAITFHRQRIRKLLGLASEWELVRYAILVSLAQDERTEGRGAG